MSPGECSLPEDDNHVTELCRDPLRHQPGELPIWLPEKTGEFRNSWTASWPHLSGTERSQPPDELVERALPAAIAGDPGATQDFGAREVGSLMQPPLDPRRVQSQLGPGSDTASWRARRITDGRHLHSTAKTRSGIESRRVSVFDGAREARAPTFCPGQIIRAEESSHLAPDRWGGAEVARARSGVVSGKYDEDRVARLNTALTFAAAESGVKKINRFEPRA